MVRQEDGDQPHFFYDKEIRREYIWVQNTPTGAIVEHTHWDAGVRQWTTESRVAANGESVEQAITLLRVQAALKCQN